MLGVEILAIQIEMALIAWSLTILWLKFKNLEFWGFKAMLSDR